MHAKTNRQNHDFQIAYFLAGSCHTPDGAYALLCDLRADREMALAMSEAEALRTEAKRLKAERVVKNSSFETEVLEARADLLELNAVVALTSVNVAAAKDELAFINKCIDRVQSLRKFAHLTDAQAHEAMQAEEWKRELISRAENFLLTTGTIPPDQFSTMRMHPEFKEVIWPAIDNIKKHMISEERINALLEKKKDNSFVSLLLEDKS